MHRHGAGARQTVLRAVSEAADALVGVTTERQQLAAQTAQASALRDAIPACDPPAMKAASPATSKCWLPQRSLFGSELAVTQTRRAYLEATVDLYGSPRRLLEIGKCGIPLPYGQFPGR